jgi:S-formylglutathione hydrolase FrmB
VSRVLVPALAAWLTATSWAPAGGSLIHDSLAKVNKSIAGHVVDYTANHGRDHRIWSAALCEKKDMYVYLPPCYDPARQYPGMIWLHGFAQDEQSFLTYVAPQLDRAIQCGQLPPMIVVAPDGSLGRRILRISAGSFFLNSKAGAYEDYVMQDVWPFMMQNYPIAPQREAHVLAGVSMGGNGAFSLGFKHADQFKIICGIFPPVNTRWIDCRGKYMANFDPCCWGWREDFTCLHEVVGRFYGVVTITLRSLVKPLYDIGPDTAAEIAFNNPIEMIDRLGIREGQLDMYIAYGGLDQFNIDAQVESFLYRAKQRGLTVDVGYDPRGKHDAATALRLMPGILCWLNQKLTSYQVAAPVALGEGK